MRRRSDPAGGLEGAAQEDDEGSVPGRASDGAPAPGRPPARGPVPDERRIVPRPPAAPGTRPHPGRPPDVRGFRPRRSFEGSLRASADRRPGPASGRRLRSGCVPVDRLLAPKPIIATAHRYDPGPAQATGRIARHRRQLRAGCISGTGSSAASPAHRRSSSQATARGSHRPAAGRQCGRARACCWAKVGLMVVGGGPAGFPATTR